MSEMSQCATEGVAATSELVAYRRFDKVMDLSISAQVKLDQGGELSSLTTEEQALLKSISGLSFGFEQPKDTSIQTVWERVKVECQRLLVLIR